MSSPSGVPSVHAPRSTPFQSFSTTCKCVIGSGFMALPYAFSQAGWLAGGLCLAFMGFRSYFTMVHILNCVHVTRARLRRLKAEEGRGHQSEGGYQYGSTDEQGSNGLTINLHNEAGQTPLCVSTDVDGVADPDVEVVSYQQIAQLLWGFWGRKFVDFVLILAQMGCGMAFLSLILSNILAVLASYDIVVPLIYVAIGVFPIVLGLVIPRSTTYLAGAAHMGNIALLVAVSTIVYFGATSPTSHFNPATLHEVPRFVSVHGVLLFFGISAFSFTAHAEIVSVEADAQSRSVYSRVLPVAMTAIVTLYMSVSIFAYTCFMGDTRSNVLLNLGNALLVNVVRLTLSATLLVNYALAVFPASQALDLVLIGQAPVSEIPHQIEDGESPAPSPSSSPPLEGEVAPLLRAPGLAVPQLKPASGMSRVSSSWGLSQEEVTQRNHHLSWYHFKGNAVRFGMVLFTFFIAVAVQNLGLLFSVVGAVFGGMLCYTLPPLFWYCLCRLEGTPLSAWRKFVLLLEVALGVTLITVGCYVGVQSARATAAAAAAAAMHAPQA